MVYRRATSPTTADAAVVCNVCGTSNAVAFDDRPDSAYTCSRCSNHQPLLRAREDLDVLSMTVSATVESAAYPQLKGFSSLLQGGSGSSCAQITVQCDGIACDVSLSINSGTVVGFDFATKTSGLPTIRLLTEDAEHVEAKAKGVVREVQTGDPVFDAAVYIESAATDADCLVVLASPAVRAAVLELLRMVSDVRLSESGVSATSSDREMAAHAIRRCVALLRIVSGATRRLAPKEVRPPPLARAVRLATFLTAPIAIAILVFGAQRYTPVFATPVFIGLGAGLVLAALVQPLFVPALRGRSTSHKEVFAGRVVAFLFLPVFTLGVMLSANGFFDDSPERVVDMPTTHSDYDDGDYRVTVVDSAGHAHGYTFKTEAEVGKSFVRARWHDGALGVRWEGDVVLVTGK